MATARAAWRLPRGEPDVEFDECSYIPRWAESLDNHWRNKQQDLSSDQCPRARSAVRDQSKPMKPSFFGPSDGGQSDSERWPADKFEASPQKDRKKNAKNEASELSELLKEIETLWKDSS